MTSTVAATLPATFDGAPIPLASGGVIVTGWRAGARITTVRALRRGQVVLQVSRQFDAHNLSRITRVEADRVHAKFIDPTEPTRLREGANGEFVLWHFEITGERSPTGLYAAVPPRAHTADVAAACLRAEAAGYQVHRGGPDDDELANRYWWSLCQLRGGGVETSDDDYDTSDEAWVAAITHHANDAEILNQPA